MYHRRTFMTGLAGADAVILAPQLLNNRWLGAAEKVRNKLKITEIEHYEFYLPYDGFNATTLFRFRRKAWKAIENKKYILV